MEGATRSGKQYIKEFPIDNNSDSDSDSAGPLYTYMMSSSPASSPAPGTSDFNKKVVEQVQKTIRAMLASGSLTVPSTPASPTSVTTYVTDSFKGDFNPADKHGASLFKTATEPLPEKEIFSLNQDNAKKEFIFSSQKPQHTFGVPVLPRFHSPILFQIRTAKTF